MKKIIPLFIFLALANYHLQAIAAKGLCDGEHYPPNVCPKGQAGAGINLYIYEAGSGRCIQCQHAFDPGAGVPASDFYTGKNQDFCDCPPSKPF